MLSEYDSDPQVAKMTAVKWSDEVTVLSLPSEVLVAGELDEILPSVPGWYEAHVLIDFSEVVAITGEFIHKLMWLHSGLRLRGYKLVLFAVKSVIKQVFVQMGVVHVFEFARDKRTALSWALGAPHI